MGWLARLGLFRATSEKVKTFSDMTEKPAPQA